MSQNETEPVNKRSFKRCLSVFNFRRLFADASDRLEFLEVLDHAVSCEMEANCGVGPQDRKALVEEVVKQRSYLQELHAGIANPIIPHLPPLVLKPLAFAGNLRRYFEADP